MGDIYTSLGHTQHNLHTHTSTGFRFALFIQIYYCSDCLNLFNMHDGTSHRSVWYELERRPNKSWSWIIVSIVFGISFQKPFMDSCRFVVVRWLAWYLLPWAIIVRWIVNWKEIDERREICYENHNVAANILTMIFHDINWACELYYIDPWLKGKARTCYRSILHHQQQRQRKISWL